MTNKTVPHGDDVEAFISAQPENRQADCRELITLMNGLTKQPPVMWGKSIVGFGRYHYKYDSGREGDFFLIGFSPRKQNLTIYVMAGFGREDLMKNLGTFKTGKSCLYVKQLSDLNRDSLLELLKYSMKRTRELYPD
ncbi:MAG: DUF1801 domain-containing protein [Flavobacteriales bacterium]|nr:DUF1801 domain-containing protein [Bacteroidota bacterium]MCB9240615.1 DUF1801 domain-containing protein [Flavobacteriales bacterium]